MYIFIFKHITCQSSHSCPYHNHTLINTFTHSQTQPHSQTQSCAICHSHSHPNSHSHMHINMDQYTDIHSKPLHTHSHSLNPSVGWTASPKIYVHPEPQNVNLFRNKLCRCNYTGSGWTLNPMKVLTGGRKGHTDTKREASLWRWHRHWSDVAAREEAWHPQKL